MLIISGQVLDNVTLSAPTLYTHGQKKVQWGNGEALELLSVEPGLLSAQACILSTYRDQTGKLVTQQSWVPLAVRFTHPNYFLRHVAFIPT